MKTMTETFDIACYARISVDLEMDRDNTSIENQKSIMKDYVKSHFPGSKISFFEDRDKSGYTFDQREGYQKMRKGLIDKTYDILIIKDFSRFSRRNSKGLVELEDLRDAGVRIISINDNIDYPTNDDWFKIQFLFLTNEMPVTDASRKVKSVIKRRQEEGKWICSVPYGYVITNTKTGAIAINPAAAAVVKKIFELYLKGWGYKKIANYMTDHHIPTPRMDERTRKEQEGEETKIKAKSTWSIVTVSTILSNDFYIGTLREGKYTRAKINGVDVKKDVSEHIVFENHHEPIIDYRTFSNVQDELKKRSTSHYRGIKKYPNVYSGILRCGDCGSPMFSLSRSGTRAAYHCGAYNNRGLKGCSSHHVRVDFLDSLIKTYIETLKYTTADMIEKLNRSIQSESQSLDNNDDAANVIQKQLDDTTNELKILTRQKARDIAKNPQNEKIIEETYDSLIQDCELRIDGLRNQLLLCVDKRNAIIRVNRVAQTTIDIMDRILQKKNLDRQDINFLVDVIYVYEDHIHIKLKSDIESVLTSGKLPNEVTLDNLDDFSNIMRQFGITADQKSKRHLDKTYSVNVISSGDPLLITLTKEEMFLHGMLSIEKRISAIK